MSDEFYSRPLFCVEDVATSVSYYVEKLGFTQAWSFPDESPIISQVGRNGLDIILDSGSMIPRPTRPSVLSQTLQQADQLGALHQELLDRGARIVAAPFEVVWEHGLFQFDVEDFDGNVLVFWGSDPEAPARAATE